MREITPEELKEILKAHKKWVKSDGKEGVMANLSMADLRNADLSEAFLIKADLQWGQPQQG